MDSDEEQFWWEFKCEFGALLEIWCEEYHKDNLRKLVKSLYKDVQRFRCKDSWWLLGREFEAIVGLAYVEGYQDDLERSWKLKLKSERRAKWQKIQLEKTLETHTRTPVTIPTHTPTPIPTLQGTMDAHKRTIAEFERTLSPEDAEGLKKVRNERRTVRAQITKTINKLNAAVTSENKIAIKRFVTELTKILDDLMAKDKEVWALMSDDCVEADQAIGAEWSDSADNALLDADKFLDGTDPSTAPPPSSSSSTQNTST